MPCYVPQPSYNQQQGYWQNGVWYTQQGYWYNGRWYTYQRPAPQPYSPLRRPREERVIELPEDGDMWHLTVVVDGGQHSQWVRQEMAAAPRLVELQRQVKSHVYAPDYWWVKDHLTGSPTPIVLLSTHRGEVVYKASGRDIPSQAEELADEIESAIMAHAAKLQRQKVRASEPRRAIATTSTSVADCPDCTPRPQPYTPAPNNRRPFPNVPDLRPNNTPTGPGGLDLSLVVLLVIAGAAGYAYTRLYPSP